VRTSKSFVREEENLKEFQNLSAEMFRYSVESARYAARVSADRDDDRRNRSGAVGVWRGGLLTLSGALPLGQLVRVHAVCGAVSSSDSGNWRSDSREFRLLRFSAERLQSLLDAVRRNSGCFRTGSESC